MIPSNTSELSDETAMEATDLSSRPQTSKSFDSSTMTSRGPGVMFLWIGLILPLLSLMPSLVSVLQELWAQVPYRYFPLAILAGVALLIGTCERGPVGSTRSIFSSIILMTGMLLGIWGMFLYSPARLQSAACLIVLGWALGWYGRTSWTRIAAICSLFFVTQPPPLGLGSGILQVVSNCTGWICSGLLEAIYVPNAFEEGVLRVEGAAIRIYEMTKDAGSIFALMFVALAWLVFFRRTLIVGLTVLLSVFLSALLANILRSLVIVLFTQTLGVDLTIGSGAIVLAIVTFLLSIVFVILFDSFAAAFFEQIELDHRPSHAMSLYQVIVGWPKAKDTEEESQPSLRSFPATLVLLVPSLLCLVMGAATFWVDFARPSSASKIARLDQATADSLSSEQSLPEQVGPLKRIKYSTETRPADGVIGRYTHAWQFDRGDSQVIVSLDFPLRDLATPSTIYEVLGWNVEKTAIVDMPGNPAWTVEELIMKNRFGVTANAWNAFLDESGTPISRKNHVSRASNSLLNKLRASEGQKRLIQVRMFLETGRNLSAEEREQYRSLFNQLFEQLRLQTVKTIESLR